MNEKIIMKETDNKPLMMVLIISTLAISMVLLFVSSQITTSYVANIKNDVSGSLVGIDFAHNQIHEGNHFFISQLYTITDNKTILIRNNQSDKKIHLIYSISANQEIDIALYEGVNITSSGMDWIAYNNNRNSNNENVLYISDGSVTFTRGNLIVNDYAGQNKNSGSIIREQEIILKSNTDYVLEVEPYFSNTKLSYLFEWYEAG